tara:strand:+ start:2226 stop:2474 length:249 start_codon:yes stop_codon:yes gene_type:complete
MIMIITFSVLLAISTGVLVYFFGKLKECDRRIRFLIKRNEKLVENYYKLDELILTSKTREELLDKRSLNIYWEYQMMKDSIK